MLFIVIYICCIMLINIKKKNKICHWHAQMKYIPEMIEHARMRTIRKDCLLLRVAPGTQTCTGI